MIMIMIVMMMMMMMMVVVVVVVVVVMMMMIIITMAIAIALLGSNDLGSSMTPTFLFRNRFYLQLSPHCPEMNKKSMWEVADTESCHLAE